MTHTVESYTKDEAESLVGKRVISRVSWGSVIRAGTTGTVLNTYPRGGGYGVTIEWTLPNLVELDGSIVRDRKARDAFSREEFEDYLVVEGLVQTMRQRLAMYARYDAYIHKALDAIREDATVQDIETILESAVSLDDCPVCTHPWGYCICREDR